MPGNSRGLELPGWETARHGATTRQVFTGVGGEAVVGGGGNCVLRPAESSGLT